MGGLVGFVGDTEGESVGAGEGLNVGAPVGYLVGFIVGDFVGENVGDGVGSFVGDLVGFCVGESVGDGVGFAVGLVGDTDGKFDGLSVGDFVGDGLNGDEIEFGHPLPLHTNDFALLTSILPQSKHDLLPSHVNEQSLVSQSIFIPVLHASSNPHITDRSDAPFALIVVPS